MQMKPCKKCGRTMRNGETDVCPACCHGVVRTDWREELARVERALAEEMKKEHRSEDYIRACQSRISGLKQAHEGE